MYLEQKLDKLASEIKDLKKLIAETAKTSQTLHALSSLAAVSDLSINVPLNHPKIATMEFVDTVFEFEIRKSGDHIREVMSIRDDSFTAGERSSPADPWFLSSGYFKTMLKRYLFAGKVFGENRRILDACCGRGWGSRLMAEYAESVTAYDIESEVITQSQDYWNCDKIEWRVGDALDHGFLEGETFDVAACMEAIEHFTKDDGIKLLDQTQASLKDKAALIGTSFFPNTRHQADNHASLKRDDHLYLWTKDELKSELSKHFDTVRIIDSWMFIATRGYT